MKSPQKALLRILLLSVIIYLVIQLLNVVLGGTFKFDYDHLVALGYTILYTVSLSYANWSLFQYLDKVFAANRFATPRIILSFIGSFAITLLVIFFLRILEEVIINGHTFHDYITTERSANYVVSVIITFIISLSFYTFYFFKVYNDNKLKEQKVIASTASAQFESLKNQIDPHFLFNSLNVLSSLIEENPDNAQKFTTSLSKIYRYVLEQKDKELVSVEEELAFAKTYMNLLKMRFENSITFEIPVESDNPMAKIVPLSLQLLLENTIKHNIVSEQKPLHIKIYCQENYLVVTNNWQKKEVLQDRKGVGLQNIISRYAILTKRKVLITQTQDVFEVRLPILTKQLSVMPTIPSDENTAYYRAKKRVEELRGFYGNLIAYCCVIPILIVINLQFSPQFQWFWFSAGGWGFGIIMHAFKVFGYSSKWEERKIKEILEKQNYNQKTWN